MATLFYNGPECRRLTKGTMITVVPKTGHSQIEPTDIEDALKRLGLEHDEVQYGRNTEDWETPQERDHRMRQEAEIKQEYEIERSSYDTDSEDGIKSFFKKYFIGNLQIAALVLLGVAVECMKDMDDPLVSILTMIVCIVGGLYLPFKGLNCIRGGDLSYGEVLQTFHEIGKGSLKDWWGKYYAPNTKKSKIFITITAVLAIITICISSAGEMAGLELIFIALTVLASPLYYTLKYVLNGKRG